MLTRRETEIMLFDTLKAISSQKKLIATQAVKNIKLHEELDDCTVFQVVNIKKRIKINIQKKMDNEIVLDKLQAIEKHLRYIVDNHFKSQDINLAA